MDRPRPLPREGDLPLASSSSRFIVILALCANFGIAIAKFLAWSVTGSAAMLAEAIHSCADTGNQLLLLFGMQRAARPPTRTHPFGYKMESYFWGFIVAIMLFTLGGLFALYEGLHKLSAIRSGGEEEVGQYGIAIIVLVVGMILEGISWYAATKLVNRLRGETSLVQFLRRSKSPEIIVIWMEDTGAMLGLALALAGVLLTMATGDMRYDAYASLAIGGLLVVIALAVAHEIKSLLIGEAANEETQARIRQLVSEDKKVERLLELRTMQLGEDEILVALKIEWEPDIPADTLVELVNDLEARIRQEIPRARYLFVEPDTSEGLAEQGELSPGRI